MGGNAETASCVEGRQPTGVINANWSTTAAKSTTGVTDGETTASHTSESINRTHKISILTEIALGGASLHFISLF